MDDFLGESLDYLTLLSQRYSSIESVSEEIINLSAILKLPKGTEHYISDIHGESKALDHVLRNGSGVIKRKINDFFGKNLTNEEKRMLATLIYYPEDKLRVLESDPNFSYRKNWNEFYKLMLDRLIFMTRLLSAKYTRSKVKKMLPKHFSYIIDELLQETDNVPSKQGYYQSIIENILTNKRGKAFVIALSYLIQDLAVDHLHIVGDIYDRGSGAHLIIDKLMSYHSLDIQWGNHDIIWMGAAIGSLPCLANVIRISLRYKNLTTLEDGYGISLLPLASFAMQTYQTPPKTFGGRDSGERVFTQWDNELYAKMEKAIAIIQFKLESQLIQRHSEYNMNNRLFLDSLNKEKGTIVIDGVIYTLNDRDFPTIKSEDPYSLTIEEQIVVDRLKFNVENSKNLQKHASFLFEKGSMYLVYNEQILYHGCIPLTETGEFSHFTDSEGVRHMGKGLLKYFNNLVKKSYKAYTQTNHKISSLEFSESLDSLWYLWNGSLSPLFGKEKMATFERYFIEDKDSHKEKKNSYFSLRDKEEIALKIIEEFQADPERAHIINGHVPVKASKGEPPVKANGKVITIDGGFSKAYQKETGIAGYTLIYNSYGLLLATHKGLESEDIIKSEHDMDTETKILESEKGRILIESTDIGKKLQGDINHLRVLLLAYEQGIFT